MTSRLFASFCVWGSRRRVIRDRKSTRLNSSHSQISYAAFCLKKKIVAREQEELERRERHYRGDRSPINVEGRTVVLLDDGHPPASSMRLAPLPLRTVKPSQII